MKAKISAPPKRRAVGINIPEEKEKTLIETVVKGGGEYIKAPADCAEEKLGYLFGLPGFVTCGESEEVREEMLIFSGYDGSSLNYTVTTLRQRGCIIPLKAILTDHNKNWQVKYLAEELGREHEYMKNMDKAAKKILENESEKNGKAQDQ